MLVINRNQKARVALKSTLIVVLEWVRSALIFFEQTNPRIPQGARQLQPSRGPTLRPARLPSTRLGLRPRALFRVGLCANKHAVIAKDRQTRKPRLKEALAAEIVADGERGIGDALTWAQEVDASPPELRPTSREARFRAARTSSQYRNQ